ncbi:shikimate dehydrogenase [Ornithinimicrobium tianjinense]|uniref:Shikimate-5-dehydrogenase (AroE) n=1 Tax=Ornithinimicrobium tianjinense TaxID=1195761 RepID=A0A917BJS3_9MICO|nr:shikimate dehydrogenase [Ornithinimicrobium tianjinense]GGF48547.1 putative shikimate-5-dehydrogenase (AroE) [Ornithinimicrobium tianjinense]
MLTPDGPDADAPPGRRAGVVGSPVAHSLSPVLHRAAYAALGLSGWTYDAHEVRAGALAAHVEALGPDWVGLSVTMPGKEEALGLAGARGEEAELTGAANTLVRSEDGWRADNTDVHGLRTALVEAGATTARTPTVLGGGATARSALVALVALGAEQVHVVVRDRLRPETAALVERLQLPVTVVRLGDGPLLLDRRHTDVVVSTLPAGAATPDVVPGEPGLAPVLLDVVYAPWPGPFARAVRRLGPAAPAVARGTGMLLHQAVRQVELMTGHDGPVEAMRAALIAAGEDS